MEEQYSMSYEENYASASSEELAYFKDECKEMIECCFNSIESIQDKDGLYLKKFGELYRQLADFRDEIAFSGKFMKKPDNAHNHPDAIEITDPDYFD